ncbi:hypothetical protein JOM56_014001 [Amanita muscaria]
MEATDESPPAFLYASDFFRTNHIFTDGDQTLIRQHLDYAEANLLDIQKLTQDVVDEDRIEDLSRQERELVDRIERCRVALAPIKKLPNDVLRRIFIICCESPTELLSRDSKMMFLITLCQVCSVWRGLALETPLLWSQIKLFCHWRISDPHSVSYVEETVKLWFTRASTCPISFEADVGPHSSTGHGRELRDLVGRVITLPSRYRKLVLKFSSKDMDVLLGKLSPDQLWDLEELETIDVESYINAESLNPPFSPATTFANLKTLLVIGYWDPNNLSSFFPFPRLQRLNIRITMSLALELFQQCPLLETCDIVMKPSDSTTRSRLAYRASYITLPQLRDLWVQFDKTEDFCSFIDQLVLSNLQSLVILASNETVFRPNEMAERVVALSQRSGTPNIRKLYFNRKLVPVLNPGILLRSLPHLEGIVTDGCVTLDEETMEGLATGTIGPCLRNLHAEVEANLVAIIKMAKQRAQNVGLNKLCVTTSRSVLGESGWNDLSC